MSFPRHVGVGQGRGGRSAPLPDEETVVVRVHAYIDACCSAWFAPQRRSVRPRARCRRVESRTILKKTGSRFRFRGDAYGVQERD